MSRQITICFAALVIGALPFQGCGGGDDGGETPDRARRAAIASANANCREFGRSVRALGRGALAEPDFAETITERVVRPSIPLLKRMAARQQALITDVDDPGFQLYATLFDPIIVLAQERLRSGLAEDAQRSRELEDQMIDLGLEQVDAAREAGLIDCDEDYQYILQQSLTG
jgi:hypothetical protein